MSSYSTAVAACEKGKAKPEPDIASHGTGDSECEKWKATAGDVKTSFPRPPGDWSRAGEVAGGSFLPSQVFPGVWEPVAPEYEVKHNSAGACEKWEAMIEPDTISYSAGTMAYDKGKAKHEPVIPSHSPGDSACEKSEATTEPDTYNCNSAIWTCQKKVAKLEPVIPSHRSRSSACEKLEAKVEPNKVSYSAAIRACEKRKAKLEPASISSHSSGDSACGKLDAKIEPDVTSYSGAIRACEKKKAKIEPVIPSQYSMYTNYSGNSACEFREATIEPDAISYSAGTFVCEKDTAREPFGDGVFQFSQEPDEVEDVIKRIREVKAAAMRAEAATAAQAATAAAEAAARGHHRTGGGFRVGGAAYEDKTPLLEALFPRGGGADHGSHGGTALDGRAIAAAQRDEINKICAEAGAALSAVAATEPSAPSVGMSGALPSKPDCKHM